MPSSYRTPNKRIIPRSSGGQFRRTTPADFGIGGTCPVCRHFLLRHYNGDERERPLDPRRFVYRCFTCNPLTEAEQALKAEIEASKPKLRGLVAMLEEAAASITSAQQANVADAQPLGGVDSKGNKINNTPGRG